MTPRMTPCDPQRGRWLTLHSVGGPPWPTPTSPLPWRPRIGRVRAGVRLHRLDDRCARAEQVFRRAPRALQDIDFPVKRGECVAIIGPSGSGKSTLIRCINYLETPTTGSITIDGKELSGQPLRQRAESRCARELGMVFYNFNLFPHKSVLDNITLAPIQVRKVTQGAGAGDSARRCWRRLAWRIRRTPSRPALRRAEAARRHRAGAGDEPEGAALRRANLGARP